MINPSAGRRVIRHRPGVPRNGFFWVNTPIITASDAEGAGALFRVSALDFANLLRTPEGNVDFAQDFFHRERS